MLHRFVPTHAVWRRKGGVDAESDVIIDGVVEEHGFLADDAHEGAQVPREEAAYIRTVDGDPSFLRVVEPRYEIREGCLTAAGLTNERDGLAFRDREADVLQYLAIRLVAEGEVVDLNTLVEDHRFRMLRLEDVRLRIQYRVDTLERRHTPADAVGGFGKVLRGVDDRVEDDEVVDERRGIYRRVIGEDEQSTEPEDDRYQRCAQKLRERMGKVVPAVDTVEGRAGGIDEALEPRAQLMLSIKALHDTQSQEGLVDGREYLCVLLLPFGRSTFERAADTSDEEHGDRHQEEHKERQLP